MAKADSIRVQIMTQKVALAKAQDAVEQAKLSVVEHRNQLRALQAKKGK